MDLGDRNERIRKRLGFRGFAGSGLLTNGRHHCRFAAAVLAERDRPRPALV
ncbi:hypothetical protein OG558_35600 [Kribbella sp. NBC_01510]|uniref:hypothetical protein n=1 Tax=Kribbella sp. NBC_01510 TaxID=2903581 RepID=UPI00386425D8